MNQIRPSGDSRAKAVAEIIEYFRKLHGWRKDRGELPPYRLTASGAWAASRPAHLYSFFRKIDLSGFRLFIDLGSGDGAAACTAGLFTRAIGLECDPFLVSRAARAARDLKLESRVSFVCADFLTQRIQEADCLYIYPDKPVHAIEDILEGWKGTLLIYGPHFPPKRFYLRERFRCGRETMSVYAAGNNQA